MEKIKVNNQIVSMRKVVKRAKLHVINKLVKQRKMLQLKKGNEAQLEKNKRKEERLATEINIIKKISVDEVSRKSLLRLTDWKAVLLSKTSTLEERSFALLASFEPLQTEVKKFLEENSTLVHLLPDFYEEWNQKRSDPMHQEAKRLKALELKMKRKELKAKIRNRLSPKSQAEYKHQKELKMQNRQENKNVPFTQNVSGNVASYHTELLDDDIKKTKANNKYENRASVNQGSDTMQQVSTSQGLPGNTKEVKWKKKRKETAIFSLKELQDQEEIKVNHESNSDDNDAEEENEVTETSDIGKKDPYFMSTDEFSSLNLASPKDSFSNVDSFSRQTEVRNFKQDFPKNKFTKKMPFSKKEAGFRKNFDNRDLNYNRQFKQMRGKPAFHQDIKSKFSAKSYNPQRKESKFFKGNKTNSGPPKFGKSFPSKANDKPSFQRNQGAVKIESGLHPSWEAKKKLKQQTSQLLPFQGKKITFE